MKPETGHRRRGAWLALIVAACTPLRSAQCASAAVPSAGAHALYVELLGKGGLWGVGYDYRLWPSVAIGVAASAQGIGGQRSLSLSPYLTAYPLAAQRHNWFVQAGPQVMHLQIRSPVPGWSGVTSTRVGLEVSTGYEYRTQWLFRVYGMVAIGAGGVAPWVGLSVGRTFP